MVSVCRLSNHKIPSYGVDSFYLRNLRKKGKDNITLGYEQLYWKLRAYVSWKVRKYFQLSGMEIVYSRNS